MNNAGFWWRFLAFIIDAILINVVFLVITIPLGITFGMPMMGTQMEDPSTAAPTIAALTGTTNLISLVVNWLYFTIMESSNWQGTLGKKALGLKVTTLEGTPIGFAQANARYWSKILSALIFMIGFIMIGFTEKKQGLHDIIAKTLVVKPA